MGYYGYHRVSSVQQKLDRGIDQITEYCKKEGITLERPIFTDKQTGKNFERPRYIVMKEDVLRAGDSLIITEVDRLGRNKQGIVEELRYYKEKGVRVLILELPTTLMNIEGGSSINKLIIDTISNMIIELYACLAQGEIEKKTIRQREGIESMKKRGEWDKYGRPHKVEWETFCKEYEEVKQGKKKPSEVMKELKLSTPTYYRYKKRRDKESINLK